MKYINASEINTLDELRAAFCKPASDLEDDAVGAIAIIGDSELLSDLLEHSDKVPDLSINCVDYEFLKHRGNEGSLTALRNATVWELFRRWDSAGLNKRRAKQPFNCKAFTTFVDIDRYCSEVMYVIFKNND